jgi:hypothetical protein
MWVIGLLSGMVIDEQHNKSTEQSTKNHKHDSKLATRLYHNEHKLNKVTEMKIAALRAIGQRKV